eukprot:scaffold3425_cov65-Phaeocystis_antarctica.AAC.9
MRRYTNRNAAPLTYLVPSLILSYVVPRALRRHHPPNFKLRMASGMEEDDPTSPYPKATLYSPKRRAHAPGIVNVTILGSGDGIHFPRPGQLVSIHYDAFVVNGGQWDSTRGPGRDKPLRFRVGKGQVISGLDEGIEQLSLGGKARIVIPTHLAYGKRGFPGLVPPDADVIFDVELTDVDGHVK